MHRCNTSASTDFATVRPVRAANRAKIDPLGQPQAHEQASRARSSGATGSSAVSAVPDPLHPLGPGFWRAMPPRRKQ